MRWNISKKVKQEERGNRIRIELGLPFIFLGKETANEVLGTPHVWPFDITGRPMKGWVMVEKDGFKRDQELKSWLEKARTFVETLPAE